MRYYGKTETGKVRSTNQDQITLLVNENKDLLAVVCDGMGGHLAGDIAASIVTNHFAESFSETTSFESLEIAKKWLGKVVNEANELVKNAATNNKNYQGMGTTLVVCLIIKGHVIIGNIGDSRCYGLKNKVFKQLTEDQTLVNMLVKTGLISKEDALTHPNRNVLMSAVGIAKNVTMDMFVFDMIDMSFLLCSDGLYNLVDKEIIQMILESDLSVEKKVETLIDKANEYGGTDNISVIIIEIDGGDY